MQVIFPTSHVFAFDVRFMNEELHWQQKKILFSSDVLRSYDSAASQCRVRSLNPTFVNFAFNHPSFRRVAFRFLSDFFLRELDENRDR